MTVGANALAQDVNGVPNADVRPGYSSISYRVGYSLMGDERPSTLAQQISFQRNFGERWSFSGAANFGKRGDEPMEFKAFQSIVQWQFADRKTAGGDGSLLVIARHPDQGNGPGRVAVVIAGKWKVREDWEIRANAATSVDYGENARDGLGVGARTEATRRIGTVGRFGVQTGHGFNTTRHFGSFQEQSHQAGLVAKGVLLHSVMVTGTALFGVTKAAPDAELKLFLTYEL